MDQVNGYTCQCNVGFYGLNCEIAPDACNPDPCEHGICSISGDSYSCSCDPGYEGEKCDIEQEPLQFEVQMEILELGSSYDSSPANNDTDSFRAQSNTLTDDVFEPYFRSQFPSFDRMEIIGYYQGFPGLGVRYKLYFLASSNVTNVSIALSLREANKTKDINFYTIGGNLQVSEILPILLSTAPVTTIASPGMLTYVDANVIFLDKCIISSSSLVICVVKQTPQ
ncbi:unnamed protein product [Porites evermanni]|uniref:EGF-like domain-containing protein n=1 Tax=Porites evermanni TaxID=104178 RepID=A0ABN8N6G8_9CNID|nr:unnamed protein product [Porites evermanni]